jgi:protein gp37
MRFAGRFAKLGERYHGLVSIGRNKRAIWTGEARLDAGKLAKPLSWRKPRRIFVNSMSDLFYEEFTNEQIAAVFGVMAACPQHTFQVLTKRATRMREWFRWAATRPAGTQLLRPGHVCTTATDSALDPFENSAVRVEFRRKVWLNTPIKWPLSNVWIGVSVENQAAYEERVEELLACPAAIYFLSVEPLIGPVDARQGLRRMLRTIDGRLLRNDHPDAPGIGGVWRRPVDLIIAGCESGPGARSCAVSWLADLRDQCADASPQVHFFLKQATAAVWSGGRKPPEHTSGCRISAGPGSKVKPGGVVTLPYLDGIQHTSMPSTARRSP